MSESDSTQLGDGAGAGSTVADRLRLGTGFKADERDGIVRRLSALDARLQSYGSGALDMELSVKDRDGADQKVTLECWLAGRSRLVATSSERDLSRALTEVRDDLRRQLDDAATRREPMSNRQLRETLPQGDQGHQGDERGQDEQDDAAGRS